MITHGSGICESRVKTHLFYQRHVRLTADCAWWAALLYGQSQRDEVGLATQVSIMHWLRSQPRVARDREIVA